jgi:signal recognition particle subunit SEC65
MKNTRRQLCLAEVEMKRSRPIIGVVLVFILGILCGSLATHLLYKCRFESILSNSALSREEGIVRRLHRKLALDDRQEKQVRAIVHDAQQEIKTARSRIRPQTEAIIEKAQAKIRAILTPEQDNKFEQMIAAHKEKLRERGL